MMKNKLSKLLDDIDSLDLTDMEETDFLRVVKGNSKEAFEMRRQRKDIRYWLYRIQTEFFGGPSAEDKENLKELFESNPLFQGWRFFGISWDVSLDDPYRIVRRDMSVEDEWNLIINSKFPQIKDDGTIYYPDIAVKERVKKVREENENKDK